MSKIGNIIQALIFAVLVAGACMLALGRDVPKRVLIATDDHAIEYPTTQGLVRIKEIIEEKSQGRIQVLIRPSAQLGSEKEAIELTQMGIIDINRVSCSPMAEFAPEFAVYSLPYLFRNAAHEWAVLDGPIGRGLLEKLAPRRLIGLAYYDSGARSFYNNVRPINSPDDLKGLKILLPGRSHPRAGDCAVQQKNLGRAACGRPRHDRGRGQIIRSQAKTTLAARRSSCAKSRAQSRVQNQHPGPAAIREQSSAPL